MQYVPREQIMQGRGRPRDQVAPRLVEALQQTLLTGTAAVQDITGEDPDTVREFKRELRKAGRHLGFRVHIQARRGQLAFYAEVEEQA
jgi:hypothetical protein